MQQSLHVNFCNLKLKNPFLLASAPPTRNAEMIMCAFDAGWAGAVTKTIGPEPTKSLRPRLATLKDGKRNIGLANIELISDMSARQWCDEIRRIKKGFPDNVVIASIMASMNLTEWQDIARTLQDGGADALELNVSCPHGMPEKAMGAAVGQNPDLVARVTEAVKKVARIPVIVKLTPNITDIRLPARRAFEAGADGLAAINTVEGLIGIDIENLTPLPDVAGHSAYGGVSGKAIKPIALRCVSQIFLETFLPVSGMGGVFTWQDCAEFILAGATTIQICTAVMFNGFGIVEKMKKGLASYMMRKGFSTVAEMVGVVSKKLRPFSQLTSAEFALTVTRDCSGCGVCVTACRDGAFQAISLKRKKAVIDLERCDRCMLCYNLCPRDAISITRLGS